MDLGERPRDLLAERHPVTPTRDAAAPDWLVGGGELGELIRTTDWTVTPLGPRERWPHPLRTMVALVVESRLPMALLWGRELLLLYNDAYREIAGERHPRALGRSTREIWPEVWHINQPIFAAVLDRGEAVYLEDQIFPIDRRDRREDAYFTLCYSPVRGECGAVAGCLVTLVETTSRVQATAVAERERALAEATLREREERLRLVIDATELGAFDYYPQTGRLEWSAQVKRHFGVPPGAEVSYATFLRGLHPTDRDRVHAAVQGALRPGSGGQYATEFRTIGRDSQQLAQSQHVRPGDMNQTCRHSSSSRRPGAIAHHVRAAISFVHGERASDNSKDSRGPLEKTE